MSTKAGQVHQLFSSLISSCIGFLSMSEDMDNIFFCKDDESFTMKMVSVVSEINAVNNK